MPGKYGAKLAEPGVVLVAVAFSAIHLPGRVAKAVPYNSSSSHSNNAKAREEGVVDIRKKFICIF